MRPEWHNFVTICMNYNSGCGAQLAYWSLPIILYNLGSNPAIDKFLSNIYLLLLTT